MSKQDIQVVVWGENIHDRELPRTKEIYPRGMHTHLAEHLGTQGGIVASTATLQEEEHGLPKERLDRTDVLLWWGHKGHDLVEDTIVERVQGRVLEGMGLICLHSAHYSKIFRRLMGTTCSLRWREADERHRLWVVDPGHPIVEGLGDGFVIEQDEMYGEPFRIPIPDEQIFISWFEGGNVFRSGCTWHRGNGRIFYFSAGHETYPIYHQPEVLRVITNAVRWARPTATAPDSCPNEKQPREPIHPK